MSFCPPPSRILCLSLLTSSSSSFRGGSFAFTGLRGKKIKKKEKNQPFKLFSKSKTQFLHQSYKIHTPALSVLLDRGCPHWENQFDYPLCIQVNPTTIECFPVLHPLWPSTRCSVSSARKLTWAWWRIGTGSAQWWGRTPLLPQPWQRDFVPLSPKTVVRQSGSPLDTVQRSNQNGGTRDQSPSSNSGSNLPMFWTQVSRVASGFFTSWATRDAQEYWSG